MRCKATKPKELGRRIGKPQSSDVAIGLSSTKVSGCGEMTASLPQVANSDSFQHLHVRALPLLDFHSLVGCIHPYSYWEISCCIVPTGFYRYKNHGWVDHPNATLCPAES
jgi:hypothetical protein